MKKIQNMREEDHEIMEIYAYLYINLIAPTFIKLYDFRCLFFFQDAGCIHAPME